MVWFEKMKQINKSLKIKFCCYTIKNWTKKQEKHDSDQAPCPFLSSLLLFCARTEKSKKTNVPFLLKIGTAPRFLRFKIIMRDYKVSQYFQFCCYPGNLLPEQALAQVLFFYKIVRAFSRFIPFYFLGSWILLKISYCAHGAWSLFGFFYFSCIFRTHPYTLPDWLQICYLSSFRWFLP